MQQNGKTDQQLKFLHKVIEKINHIKKVLYSGEDCYSSEPDPLGQIMPLMHILIYIFTYMPLLDCANDLKKLAESLCELRMLPIPYGMLVNELIEVLDQERLMPGLTLIGKTAEDFPFLDLHSSTKMRNQYNH
jgi:hypothetical protein